MIVAILVSLFMMLTLLAGSVVAVRKGYQAGAYFSILATGLLGMILGVLDLALRFGEALMLPLLGPIVGGSIVGMSVAGLVVWLVALATKPSGHTFGDD